MDFVNRTHPKKTYEIYDCLNESCEHRTALESGPLAVKLTLRDMKEKGYNMPCDKCGGRTRMTVAEEAGGAPRHRFVKPL